MLVQTQHFGIVETKPKRVFECKGESFAIVEYPYKYMNSKDTSYTRKIVHFKTGVGIPVFAQHKQTLKSFLEVGINTIEQIYKSLGEEKFKEEINKHEKLN